MIRISAALAAALLLLLPSCKKSSVETEKPPPAPGPGADQPSEPPATPPGDAADADLAKLVEGQNAFALDLYEALRTGEGNLAFSPASVSAALAMTYAGARRDTAREIKTAMQFRLGGKRLHRAFEGWLKGLESVSEPEGQELAIANRLWADKGLSILADFQQIPATHYSAPVDQLDFIADGDGSRATINAWVEEQTGSRIKDIVQTSDIDASTRLVLTNAIYFAGTWVTEFDAERTSKQTFHAPDGTVEVPMMHLTGKLRASAGDGLQVLELPYVGDRLSMIFLLPEAKDGLPELEAELREKGLAVRLTGLAERAVAVALPRFTVVAAFHLEKVLPGMGMTSAFTSGKADFSGITGNRDLHVSAVVHKAFVKVDEKGTEAAAATAISMKKNGPPKPAMQFVADHPFLFLLRDKRTGSILFLGRVVTPDA